MNTLSGAMPFLRSDEGEVGTAYTGLDEDRLYVGYRINVAGAVTTCNVVDAHLHSSRLEAYACILSVGLVSVWKGEE